MAEEFGADPAFVASQSSLLRVSTEGFNPGEEEASREVIIFARLCTHYIQSADERQRSMGLQYMEAETHELARFIDALVDDLDESCKHGFANWRDCACCTIRDEIRATQSTGETKEEPQS